MNDARMAQDDNEFFHCAGCLTVYCLPKAILEAGFSCPQPGCRSVEIIGIVKHLSPVPSPVVAAGPIDPWPILQGRGFAIEDRTAHKRYADGHELIFVARDGHFRGFWLKRESDQTRGVEVVGPKVDLKAMFSEECKGDVEAILAALGRSHA